MTLCPFDDAAVAHLAPLTLTRPAADLRVGARTLLAAAQAAFPSDRLALRSRPAVAGMACVEHPGTPVNEAPDGPTLFVNGRWRAEPGPLVDAVRQATDGRAARAFVQGDTLVALWHPDPPATLALADGVPDGVPTERVDGAVLMDRLWSLTDDLGARVAADVEALGGLGVHDGADVQDGARLVAPDAIHLAPGAVVRAGAVVSAADGPVHVGAGAVVEENAVVRGPCYLGPKAVVKAAGRVDGSAIGWWSKVGGEVHESIVHSLSSKAHDGYLGNSYLGRWCNLGADTNTSNLKNDYGEVTMYDAVARRAVPTGRQFLGLVMGDHSKCAINTQFNTGTVVGVFCNLFQAGFPPRWVPHFSWGGADGLKPYRVDKALEVAEAVLARRGMDLSDAERALLTAIAAEATSTTVRA